MMRRGPYWIVLGFSLLVVITSLNEEAGRNSALNATLVCLLLLLAAGFELAGLPHWMDLVQTGCGIWLAISPLVFGYTGTGQVGYWHIAMGFLLALLGILQLVYGWKTATKKKRG